MGFYWSEISPEINSFTLRYYNDLIWYVYSLLGFFPLVFLTIYKVSVIQDFY